MKPFNCVLHTEGDGYWSSVKKPVVVTRISLPYVNDEDNFGELRVYFDTASWNVSNDGLIYTDSRFLDELRGVLSKAGYAGHDPDYSEQGMQGRNYVSLDVGKDFIQSWLDAA